MQYGEVTDVFIPKPFRAFAFVTFADDQVRAATLENLNYNIWQALRRINHTVKTHKATRYYDDMYKQR